MDRQVVEVSSLSLSFCFFLWLSTYLHTYLSMCPSISLSVCLSIYLPTYLSIYLIRSDPIRSDPIWSIDRIYLSIYLSIYLPSIRPSVRPSVHPSIHRSIYPSIHPSIYLQACKRSYSARLPQFLKLDNIKNAAIQRDFLNFCTWQHQKRSNSARLPSKMESWVESWRPRTNACCDFSSPSV